MVIQKLLPGAVLGGLALFAWSAVSWTLLPWHAPTFEKFQNETLVLEAIKASAGKAGIYLAPSPRAPENQGQRAHDLMGKGPFVFAVVKLEGVGPMSRLMLRAVGIQTAAALLVTSLLVLAKIKSYWSRVGFSVLFALAAGIVGYLPNWNWWGFSLLFTLIGIADLLISWFLAGLAIAWTTKPGR